MMNYNNQLNLSHAVGDVVLKSRSRDSNFKVSVSVWRPRVSSLSLGLELFSLDYIDINHSNSLTEENRIVRKAFA